MNDLENTSTTLSDKEEAARLRAEMQALKATLDSQRIFNEQTMRRVMADRTGFTRRIITAEKYFLFPASCLLFLFLKYAMGTSWLFFAVTILMFVLDLVSDILINDVKAGDYATESLVSLRAKLLRQRRRRRMQMIVSVPALVLWAVWFCFELVYSSGIYATIGWVPTAIVVAIAMVIGLVAAIIIYRKMQDADRDALADLDSCPPPIP